MVNILIELKEQRLNKSNIDEINLQDSSSTKCIVEQMCIKNEDISFALNERFGNYSLKTSPCHLS